MRRTFRNLGWLMTLGLAGCPENLDEVTSIGSLSFGDTGGNDESAGSEGDGGMSSAETGASADGGSTDGGPGDGGPTDGGPTDGGPTDGGPTDGGPTDGGPESSSDGGVSDAGTTGRTDGGGSSSDGGGGSTGGGSMTGGGGGGACCDVQDGPGCDDMAVQDCVCAFDGYCCDTQWDDVCVAEANDSCDAMCGGGGSSGTDGGGAGGACCDVQMGPGCDDMAVQDCVCAFDGYCCDTQWDDVCVAEANDSCDAMCGGGGGGGACCDVQMGPGCDDMAVQDCVCAFDGYCCDTQWDDVCVAEANDSCDAMCGGGGGGGACCDVQMGPGCDDMTVQDCVCAFDGYCCDTQWDDVCVAEANDSCGAMCGGGGGADCCALQDGPGCGDAMVEDCVCGNDPFCCDTQWDDICVGEAADCGAAC